MELKTEDVSSYLARLMSMPDGAQIVTESGFQAAPVLHSYLARTYIAEGKYEEAEKIISSLEQNCATQLVAEPGAGGQPEWTAVSELASQFKQAISAGSSGGVPSAIGPGGGPPPGLRR
jgi:hypothetical protein